jgi:hypothetical protein
MKIQLVKMVQVKDINLCKYYIHSVRGLVEEARIMLAIYVVKSAS